MIDLIGLASKPVLSRIAMVAAIVSRVVLLDLEGLDLQSDLLTRLRLLPLGGFLCRLRLSQSRHWADSSTFHLRTTQLTYGQLTLGMLGLAVIIGWALLLGRLIDLDVAHLHVAVVLRHRVRRAAVHGFIVDLHGFQRRFRNFE